MFVGNYQNIVITINFQLHISILKVITYKNIINSYG